MYHQLFIATKTAAAVGNGKNDRSSEFCTPENFYVELRRFPGKTFGVWRWKWGANVQSLGRYGIWSFFLKLKAFMNSGHVRLISLSGPSIHSASLNNVLAAENYLLFMNKTRAANFTFVSFLCVLFGVETWFMELPVLLLSNVVETERCPTK